MSRPEFKKFMKSLSFVTFNFWYTAAVLFVDFTFWYILRELTLTLSVHKRARNILESTLNEGSMKVAAGQKLQMAASMIVQLRVVGGGLVPIIYR